MSDFKMPEGWKDRIEWFSLKPWLSDKDADLVRLKAKFALKQEAIFNRNLYDDCGELNTTALVESIGQDYELNVSDPVVDVWYIPEQFFEWAVEIAAWVEEQWANQD